MIATGTPKGLSDVVPGDEVVVEVEGVGKRAIAGVDPGTLVRAMQAPPSAPPTLSTREGEVLDLLGSLKEQGVTMLLNTHEMGFARRVADRVCFLSGGRVLEQGPPEQVLENPQHERTAGFLSRLHT